MQEYVEDRLTELHEVAVKNKFLDKFFAFVLASFLIVILPYLHIGLFFYGFLKEGEEVGYKVGESYFLDCQNLIILCVCLCVCVCAHVLIHTSNTNHHYLHV